MSAEAPIAVGSNPFRLRTVILLVLFGTGVFVLLLWMIGSGMASGSSNDGGSHAASKGLTGYAALAGLLERRGIEVATVRQDSGLQNQGLLVLTPPHNAEGSKLESIVQQRRYVGPTLIVLPKWQATPVPQTQSGVKPGWVALAGANPPNWSGFYDDVSVRVEPVTPPKGAGWSTGGLTGRLPDGKAVLSGSGMRLAPLVVSRPNGRVLAAYVDDGGDYQTLEKIALSRASTSPGSDNPQQFPVIMVFEPDLLNNYGMADAANAKLAMHLIGAARGYAPAPVTFDLTLNGQGRSANLLTLAFTPPFLAATMCLLLAMTVVGWRAFLRFGPGRQVGRAIAFGKTALVANAAGLLRRTGRVHLITRPYLERSRERIARALALSRSGEAQALDAAIDRALVARVPGAPEFSRTAARLAAARSVGEVMKAARQLHSLERMLTR